MNPLISQIHARADRLTSEAIARGGVKPPCCSGCHHCCRESVIASSQEINGALELLTPVDREVVAFNTVAWMTRFRNSGLERLKEPPAIKYRALHLWCPLLDKQGKCRVYERRPLACRLHIAHESSDGCEFDHKRSQQKYALFPSLIESLAAQRLEGMRDGEEEINDHLGVLLARELLHDDLPTPNRVIFTAHGDTLTIQQYEQEEVTA